ncbi:hypothetical protein Pmani_018039 [Petrolisthes manimaculis]|uniref:Uncharacterized protein n=1 Tax=Petrolisthes manimaculis TaxID=1843537 RepID=A0AAE1PNH4_9EUCA|nr:hypothetical protein Pmani_018039 [Petrolisthes manimaculis]
MIRASGSGLHGSPPAQTSPLYYTLWSKTHTGSTPLLLYTISSLTTPGYIMRSLDAIAGGCWCRRRPRPQGRVWAGVALVGASTGQPP